MSNEETMKEFRKNPELFRLHLVNSFKECTAKIKKQVSEKNAASCELIEQVETNLNTAIDQCLKEGFQNLNLQNNANELAQLEENTPKGVIAWRPVTGVVDPRFKEHGLMGRKTRLQSKIKKLDQKAEQLQQTIDSKRKSLQKNHLELQKVLNTQFIDVKEGNNFPN